MNNKTLQEFYDLVYEQAVEDTMEYLNETTHIDSRAAHRIKTRAIPNQGALSNSAMIAKKMAAARNKHGVGNKTEALEKARRSREAWAEYDRRRPRKRGNIR